MYSFAHHKYSPPGEYLQLQASPYSSLLVLTPSSMLPFPLRFSRSPRQHSHFPPIVSPAIAATIKTIRIDALQIRNHFGSRRSKTCIMAGWATHPSPVIKPTSRALLPACAGHRAAAMTCPPHSITVHSYGFKMAMCLSTHHLSNTFGQVFSLIVTVRKIKIKKDGV
ncbi:hypothetical protein PoB_005159300 [Plakobranchus ocellatus]|uniref:Uncharacterized protein n=1 Tax=Plakobranchus ocellatus TaxID=259542 RepID=A0AAV4BZN4_9GAST|nr:hypothetical protein PoB_005159300 [Plakobranchus ocellatus]